MLENCIVSERHVTTREEAVTGMKVGPDIDVCGKYSSNIT